MSARKVQIVPAPVLAKFEGFEVSSPAQSPSVTTSQKPKQSVSLLSLEISSTLSSEGTVYTDEDCTETDCYSDDDEEECGNSPSAIPIAIKVQTSTESGNRAR